MTERNGPRIWTVVSTPRRPRRSSLRIDAGALSVVMKMEGSGIAKMEGPSESEREMGVVGFVQDVVDGTAIVT
jgi:hypothetical protein